MEGVLVANMQRKVDIKDQMACTFSDHITNTLTQHSDGLFQIQHRRRNEVSVRSQQHRRRRRSCILAGRRLRRERSRPGGHLEFALAELLQRRRAGRRELQQCEVQELVGDTKELDEYGIEYHPLSFEQCRVLELKL